MVVVRALGVQEPTKQFPHVSLFPECLNLSAKLSEAAVDSEHLLHLVNYFNTSSDEQQLFALRHVIIGLFGSVYKDFLTV